MEVTRKRHTPENMLIILKEIEGLCDKGQLVPKNCRPTIPAIYNILMVLMDKGVVSKKIGKYTWTGGKPNIYMAKEVIKENQKYQFELLEKRVERERNTKKYLSETIDSTQINDIPELELYEPIKENVVDRQEDYLGVIQDLKKQLAEYELDLSELLKENENLKSQINEIYGKNFSLKEDIKRIKFNKEFEEAKELMSVKRTPKKVKFLGITIFKID